jgi:hypothetical protein
VIALPPYGDSGPTQAGEQRLIAGVASVPANDGFALRAAAPLPSARPQRPTDFGLFDRASRDQLDHFQHPECNP